MFSQNGEKYKPEDEVELKEMLFNNLTWLHLENAKQYDENMSFEKLHDEISSAYITHHVSVSLFLLGAM